MLNLNLQENAYYYIGAGTASGDSELNAFDRALLASGCGNYNLLRVSSILPAGAKIVDRIGIKEGSLLPVAYACLTTEPKEYAGSVISAAVAVGIPDRTDAVGVIMEYSGACPEEAARDQVVSMVRTAMADRGIAEYEISVSSCSRVSSEMSYDCVFAYAALFGEERSEADR